ncbi:MAG TPA: hypothetical protein QGF58_20015 [Myxococcota bacterium]|jgi:hypothetical protein|nr:hypothetical protein [Myxococcota bacterium]
MNESTPRLPSSELLRELAAHSKKRARLLLKLADRKRDDSAEIGRITRDLGQLPPGSSLVEELGAWLSWEERTRGRRLVQGLTGSCEVISRDPLRLRVAPLTVNVDVENNRAELRFAELQLARVPADAERILAAHAELIAALEPGDWSAQGFLRHLLQAWRQRGEGGWAELIEVLPVLALQLQSDAFRRDPTARNFRPYPKVQFAYDLARLRRERCFSVDGWRLSLGPATGSSTRDKRRVFWLEDPRGRGQWHLSLRFVEDHTHV